MQEIWSIILSDEVSDFEKVIQTTAVIGYRFHLVQVLKFAKSR